MALNTLIKQEKIIAVDMNYLTDDGVIIYRVWGKSTYWVREDNFTAFMNKADHLYAYNSVSDAYEENNGVDIRRMQTMTRNAFLVGLASAIKAVGC